MGIFIDYKYLLMKYKTHLTAEAADYVFNFYKKNFSSKYVYHDYKHFHETVQACDEIAAWYELEKEEVELLLVAAWFHDLGYINKYDNHEEYSVMLAENFLKLKGVSENKINRVKELILSTKIGHVPANLLEEILHDADLINIGRKNFFLKAQMLRLEWETFLNKHYSDKEWEKLQLDFLLNNNFYTQYTLKEYGAQRAENIDTQTKILRKKIDGIKRTKSRIDTQPKRGVETMYRSTYRNHINLSAIADNKANMMISINTIIMSIIISVMGSRFGFYSQDSYGSFRFILPMCILLLASLLSVIYAVLSARPKVTHKKASTNPSEGRDGSLLFFGNFVSLPLNNFIEQMHDLTKNKDLLYDNMTVDIYHLGAVLTKKYRLLRVSYNIFMIGLIITVIAFLIVFLQSWTTPT